MKKNKYFRLIIESVLAGVLIGIGVLCYLNISNKIVGAFVFSVGLLSVLFMKAKLFTGAIGFAGWKDLPEMLLIFLGNAIGISFCGLYGIDSAEMFAAKLAVPLPLVFLKGIVCGILIYAAVYYFRNFDKVSSVFITILCVAAFILCGSEHCIADIGYLFAAKSFTFESLLFIIVVALGNGVGAKAIDLIIGGKN